MYYCKFALRLYSKYPQYHQGLCISWKWKRALEEFVLLFLYFSPYSLLCRFLPTCVLATLPLFCQCKLRPANAGMPKREQYQHSWKLKLSIQVCSLCGFMLHRFFVTHFTFLSISFRDFHIRCHSVVWESVHHEANFYFCNNETKTTVQTYMNVVLGYWPTKKSHCQS